MKATIVTIGDEILIGQVTDTNSGYIAKALEKIGVSVHEMISISDDRQHILDTFSKLQDKTDFVIITGGLGPTKDDITKKTFCDYFDDTLISDQNVLDHIVELFKKFSDRPLQQVNIDQALVPSKATVLFNRFGSAPGMWVRKNSTVFMSLPGVPFEMKGIVDYEIIEDWENDLPEFIKLAYLPSPGKVRLRLSARGKDQSVLEKAIEEYVASLTQIIGDIIVGFDDTETLEVVLGRLLTQQNKTVSTAESCTGGKIAQIITSIPGSSKYFKGSVVAYAKEVKIDVLGVARETIQKHTVVSGQVAEEMAANVRKLLQTDYGIGITGNAGPTTDDTDKSVGIVYIALATPNGVASERFDFGQPREKVIDRAVNKSLEMLQSEILKRQ